MTRVNCSIYPTYKISVDAKAVTANRILESTATEISADLISIRTDRPIMPATAVNISIVLDEEIMLQGNVMWVLDTQTDSGEHYYLTGIRTDAIVHPKQKAIGRAQKSRLLQEILFSIMERSKN